MINIDYEKNKKYQPTTIKFGKEIDINEFADFNYKQKIRYIIIGVYTQNNGNYLVYCRSRENNTWYKFNDSICFECNAKEIYKGSPYLLLYQRTYNN